MFYLFCWKHNRYITIDSTISYRNIKETFYQSRSVKSRKYFPIFISLLIELYSVESNIVISKLICSAFFLKKTKRKKQKYLLKFKKICFWTSRLIFLDVALVRNFPKFTGKHLCQSPFSIKRLWHRCFCFWILRNINSDVLL